MAAVQKPLATGQVSGCGDEGASPEKFPAGMRVLVVDDDMTCLMIMKEMLQRCHYEVAICSRATAALSILREKKGSFDIVISDVHMQDMDGFKLLEHVGLEMDLPVIMMSGDGRTSSVMRGIQHGACDYLIKPVRIEELRNIWQHVVRKKWSEYKESEHSNSLEDSSRQRHVIDEAEYASSRNDVADDPMASFKNKRDNKEDDTECDLENEDSSSTKKPRVVWSVELHQQFVNAVNQLGVDKAVPKRILELMNVHGLTRENVASHLQKFRLYLRRLSSVAQQTGNPIAYHGPGSDGAQAGSPYGLDFQALAASGQIPPQTLAALHAELLGQPSGTFMLPVMSQPVPSQTPIQAAMPISPACGISASQCLLKCQDNPSKQLSEVDADANNIVPDLSSWSSPNYIGRESLVSSSVANNGQNGTLLIPMRQLPHQKQLQQQQQQHPGLQGSGRHEANAQPVSLAVPSQVSYNYEFRSSSTVPLYCNSLDSQSSSGYETGKCSVTFDLISSNGRRIMDYNLLPSQLDNASASARKGLDASVGDVGVLNSYPVLRHPSSVLNALPSSTDRTDSSSSWRLPNLPVDMDASANLRHLVPTVSSCLVPGAKAVTLPDLGQRNLGFVGTGTCIPGRLNVEDIEFPDDSRNGKTIDHADRVQQNIHADRQWRT